MFLVACDGPPAIPEHHATSVEEAYPWGEGAVSRSSAGGVVAWDAHLAPTRVLVDAGAAHLGVVDGTVVVATHSGDILVFDANGARSSPVHVDEAYWVGGLGGRPTAASLHFEPAATGMNLGVTTTGLLDGPSTTTRLELGRLAFLFDGPDPNTVYSEGPNIYLGWNGGEWGGGLVRLTPNQGTGELVASGPVYGVARVHGEVRALGGQTHLGDLFAYIDGLYDRGLRDPGAGPVEPITHALERPDGSVVVLTDSGATWVTDSTIEAWAPVPSATDYA